MSTIIIDFESFYGVKYSLTQLSYEEYINHDKFKIHCVGIKVDQEDTYIVYGDTEIRSELRRLFPPGNSHVMVAHNLYFDGSIACWHYGIEAGMYICTQRISAGLFPHDSNSLANTAILCFPRNTKIRKGREIVGFKDVVDLTPEQKIAMTRYCINDVDVTFEIMMHMVPQIPNDELKIIDICLKMFLHRPLLVDKPRLEAYLDSLCEEREKIVAASGLPKETLASTAKFAKWIQEQEIPFQQVLSPTKRNPQNLKWPLAKDADQFLQLQIDHPEHDAVWKARLNMASNIELTRTERVLRHSEQCPMNPGSHIAVAILPYGAGATLRFSGGNKSNFQNMGRDSEIRRSLMAQFGYKICVHDQSAIEARMIAWWSQEPRPLEIFAEDGDVYADFASTVYGEPVDKSSKPQERFVGKVSVLSLCYGVGAVKLRRTLALGSMGPSVMLGEQQCQQIVSTYRRSHPHIVARWREADKVLTLMMSLKAADAMPWAGLTVRKGSIELPNGMLLMYPKIHRVYDEETGDSSVQYWNGKHWVHMYGAKLVQNITQALARVVVADNLITAAEMCASYNDASQVSLMVHDEIVSMVSDDNVKRYQQELDDAMRIPPAWCAEGNLTLDVESGFAQNYSK